MMLVMLKKLPKLLKSCQNSTYFIFVDFMYVEKWTVRFNTFILLKPIPANTYSSSKKNYNLKL